MHVLLLFDDVSSVEITSVSDSIVPIRGGKVVEIVGTGFTSAAVVDLLQSSVVQGQGYIFDTDFDVTATSIFVGLPALPEGTYDLRVTVGADVGLLESAFVYRLFAEEGKVQRVRKGFSPKWRTGPRILTNNTEGLVIP